MISSNYPGPDSWVNRLTPKTPAGYFRMVADSVVLVVSLALAVFFRLLWMISKQDIQPARAVNVSIHSILMGTIIIVPVSIVVFSFFGFYTFGRAYSSRFKMLTVLKGASVSFLISALILLLTRDNWDFSRGVIIFTYLIATLSLIFVRIGTRVWRDLTRAEKPVPTVERPKRFQRILVIGGAGYIGSALIPKLLAKGYTVRIFDRMIYGDGAITKYLDNPRVEVIRADFRQIDAIVTAMQDVDGVVHLGAIVGDPACALNEQLTIDINLIATQMIAEVAKGLGIHRFVFASTCSVYGASDELLDEHSALNPVSLYAKTKIACERVLLRMASAGFHPCILRFSTIYGLSGRTRFDLVINLLTAKALFDGEITVSGGDQWRPFVHVEDAALGILRALDAPIESVSAQIFNIGGNGENFTIGGAAEIIRKIVPTAVIKEIAFDGDRRNYRVCFDKAERELQLCPEWTLERGVVQVADAIRSGRIKSYRDPEYSNVIFLKNNGILGSLDLADASDEMQHLVIEAGGGAIERQRS